MVLVVALAVWGARRGRDAWVRARGKRAFESRPGASPDNPLVLTSARVLEDARAALRCSCGGEVKALGEAPRLGLRVARGRCMECDSDVDLYFVLPQLLN